MPRSVVLLALLTGACGSGVGMCPPGYTGENNGCVDIDECAAAAASGTAICDPHASCLNTPGSFDCRYYIWAIKQHEKITGN